jgi:hypothetical protein
MSTKTEFEEMIESVEENASAEPQDQEEGPSPSPYDYDSGWSEYLLDHLSDNELINGAPTVDGLRRVCEMCFGEILESKSTIVETPTPDNNRCTICHSLTIRKYRSDTVVKIDGCVDVLYHKTPYPFKDHLVATADTRAEGKALRRALKIRVITAEELQNEDEEVTLTSDEQINDQQVLAINQLCKRLDISVTELVKAQYNNVKSLNEINNLEARLLISKLSGFQRDSDAVADKLKGYDENWKDDFYRRDGK